jgi:hypothetical protein
MKRHLKRGLEIVLVFLAAAFVFFEQTLIRYLNNVMVAVAAWPPIARLEAWLVTLPPYVALLAFVAPSLLILPIKVVALWFGMHGKYVLALVTLIPGQAAGDRDPGAALSHPAADPDGDSLVRLGRHHVLRLARPHLCFRALPAGLAEGGDDGAAAAYPDRGIGFRPVCALGS